VQHLDPSIRDEDEARKLALSLTVVAARGEMDDANPKPRRRAPKGAPLALTDTLDVWAERWCDVREERGLTSVKDDRGRLKKWVFPKLINKQMNQITRRDLEELVEDLDTAVRDEELSSKQPRTSGRLSRRCSTTRADPRRWPSACSPTTPALACAAPTKA
jgi:hypothetical protein